MADDGRITKEAAEEMHRADISMVRGKLATKIKDPEKRRAFIAKQGQGEEESLKAIGRVGGKDEDTEADTMENLKKYRLQGSLKKGGKIKKTGIYRLHKGEKVLNSKQAKKSAIKR